MAEKFRCYLVDKDAEGRCTGKVTERSVDDLPPGDVLIKVHYSSLNFKDALSAQGHPGVTRKFPHVPGVDVAGEVVQSSSPLWKPGKQVIVTGHDQGQNTWGGFSQFARVPASWVVALPDGITLRDSMIYGTAGLTAALCIDALRVRGVTPERGDVVVTGSTGGVGSVAVAILAKLGYSVTAVTGKKSSHAYLKELGATTIIDRSEVNDPSNKPMLSERWAGAVDTVGGSTLSTIVRSAKHRGVVTACGLVGGHELPLTVYPFILRGVDLVGIDTAEYPTELRIPIWHRLATTWKPQQLDSIATNIATLDNLAEEIEKIFRGKQTGRVVVRLI